MGTSNSSSEQVVVRAFCTGIFPTYVVYFEVGGVQIVFSYITAYIVEVVIAIRMKLISIHSGRWRCASVFAINLLYASSPSIGCTLPLFRSS